MSLIGIPITLLTLKSIGELLAKWFSAVVSKFEKKILKGPEPKQVQTKSAVMLFSFMIMIILVTPTFLVIPDWNYLQAVYFWFITFSTIGFGDYIPITVLQSIQQLSLNISKTSENKHTSDYIANQDPVVFLFLSILQTLYCILGLCIVSSVINSIMAAIEEHNCRPWRLRCNRRETKGHVDKEQTNTPEHRYTDMTYLQMEASISASTRVFKRAMTI